MTDLLPLTAIQSMVRLLAAVWLMIEFSCAAAAFAAEPNFSASDVLNGVVSKAGICRGPGTIWVEADGREDCLRFYGATPEGSVSPPVVFLEGDVVQRTGRGVTYLFPPPLVTISQ